MTSLVPSSWGSAPLREANDCHSPSGSPAGGQFCSKGAGAAKDGEYSFPKGGPWSAVPVASVPFAAIRTDDLFGTVKPPYGPPQPTRLVSSDEADTRLRRRIERALPVPVLGAGEMAVYRLQGAQPGLANTNAASLDGLVSFLRSAGPGFRFESGFAGRHLHLYRVKMGHPGAFRKYRAGRVTTTASDLKEFNPYHDAKGRFTHAPGGTTRVGITSSSNKAESLNLTNRDIFAQSRAFAGELRALPGVRRVKVSPGVGGFEGGGESTWIVSYSGNGAARKLLARTARRYNQDSVLLMHGCKGRACDPAVDFVFEGGVTSPKRAAIHDKLVANGLKGWTWLKSRSGQTVLRVVSVPAWGGKTTVHLASTRTISTWLGQNGYRHATKVRSVRAEVIEKAAYDKVASGKG